MKMLLRFGDANLSPGTRIHFVEIPNKDYSNQHIDSIGTTYTI